jgi:predicted nucleotidyltransferase
MAENLRQHYQKLLLYAKLNPYVLGLVLAGSRGKGKITAHSDYDIFIIIKDKTPEKIRKELADFRKFDFDSSVMDLTAFKKYAAWGSPYAWDRYNFARLKAPLDKTGQVQKIVTEKGLIPTKYRAQFIKDGLDHYINQVYRSIKTHCDGDFLASRLESNESIQPMLNAVFALHGRLKPYYKYLEWELKREPLKKLPISQKQFIKMIGKIAKTGDSKTQKQLLRILASMFLKNGYRHGWEWKFDWLINY